MSRLQKALELRAQIKELGDYDCQFVGAIGEIFAEERLGMIKAPRHETKIDGHINGRSVQVKTRNLPGSVSAHYVAIANGKWDGVDDLVAVVLNPDESFTVYQGSVSELPFTQNKRERRYYLKNFPTVTVH